MKPRDLAALLQRTADQLPHLPALRDPHALAAVRNVLQAEMGRLAAPTVRLVWERPDLWLVDGRSLPHEGKGLPLAFMALALDEAGIEPLPVSAFFPGKRAEASAIQALGRAADALGMRCRPLAEAIHGIGTSRGLVVVKRRPYQVECSSPWMAQFYQRAAALGYEV